MIKRDKLTQKGNDKKKMNVSYKDINAIDAARMLGVDKTTVQGWCRNEIINFIDVSEPGSKRARYLIRESEVDYIKKLIKKHGVRKAMFFYKKDHDQKIKEAKKVESGVGNIPWYMDVDTEAIENEVNKELCIPVEEPKEKAAHIKLDADKIATTIMYIQDIKERIEDCKAELNQLQNEYEQLKKEISDVVNAL